MGKRIALTHGGFPKKRTYYGPSPVNAPTRYDAHKHREVTKAMSGALESDNPVKPVSLVLCLEPDILFWLGDFMVVAG